MGKAQVMSKEEAKKKDAEKKKKWEGPKLEDVSGKIMAQPYIRFT